MRPSKMMDEAEIEHVSDREVPSSESGSGRRTAGPWEVVQPATTRASSRRTKRAPTSVAPREPGWTDPEDRWKRVRLESH